MQAISVMQVLVAFFIQLPIVADTWKEENLKLARTLGLSGYEDEKYNIYARFHYVAVCLAVVCTQVHAVSTRIYNKQLKRIKDIKDA